MTRPVIQTRKLAHEEVFSVSAERLFKLLHTPSAIRKWWGAARAIVIPEANGVWTAAWGDKEDTPDYTTVANIHVFEPPSRIVLTNYRVISHDGPSLFEYEFVTTLVVSSDGDGASLRIVQDGFPAGAEADEFYSGCEIGWRKTFAGIRSFLE